MEMGSFCSKGNVMQKFIVFLTMTLFITPIAQSKECKDLFGEKTYDTIKEFIENPIAREPGSTKSKEPTYSRQDEKVKAAKQVYEFLNESTGSLLEREFLRDLIFLSFATREHVLLLGPAGTAKSLISRTVLPNILERGTGKNSFWKIQMTPDATTQDTHGPNDPKVMLEEGRYDRLWKEGMLYYKSVFIDEIFDANPKSERNILEAVNERSFTSGSRTFNGKLEVVMAATNTYISEVFARAAKMDRPEAPRAVLDRFAFKAYVPEEFNALKSDISLIRGGERKPKPDPIYYDQIEALRALAKEVEFPEHVVYFVQGLTTRIHEIGQVLERKSVNDYNKKRMEGKVDLEPPYRRTTYLSKRTISKVKKILQAIVVMDYVAKGGNRPLEITIEDVKNLSKYYTLQAPGNPQQMQKLLDRARVPDDRSQINTVIQENQTFNKVYNELLDQYNAAMIEMAYKEQLKTLDEIEKLPESEQLEAATQLAVALVRNLPNMVRAEEAAPWENDGKMIAQIQYNDIITQRLTEIVGESQMERVLQPAREKIEIEMEEARQAELKKQEEERLEQERIAAAEAKVEALKESFNEYYLNDGKAVSFAKETSLTVQGPMAVQGNMLVQLSSEGKKLYVISAKEGVQRTIEFDPEGSLEIASNEATKLYLTSDTKTAVIVDSNQVVRIPLEEGSNESVGHKIFSKEYTYFPTAMNPQTGEVISVNKVRAEDSPEMLSISVMSAHNNSKKVVQLAPAEKASEEIFKSGFSVLRANSSQHIKIQPITGKPGEYMIYGRGMNNWKYVMFVNLNTAKYKLIDIPDVPFLNFASVEQGRLILGLSTNKFRVYKLTENLDVGQREGEVEVSFRPINITFGRSRSELIAIGENSIFTVHNISDNSLKLPGQLSKTHSFISEAVKEVRNLDLAKSFDEKEVNTGTIGEFLVHGDNGHVIVRIGGTEKFESIEQTYSVKSEKDNRDDDGE